MKLCNVASGAKTAVWSLLCLLFIGCSRRDTVDGNASGGEMTRIPVTGVSGSFEIVSTNVPPTTNVIMVSTGTPVKLISTNGDLLLVEFPPTHGTLALTIGAKRYMTEWSRDQAFDGQNSKNLPELTDNSVTAWTWRFNICSQSQLDMRVSNGLVPDQVTHVVEPKDGLGVKHLGLIRVKVENGEPIYTYPDYLWLDRSLIGRNVQFETLKPTVHARATQSGQKSSVNQDGRGGSLFVTNSMLIYYRKPYSHYIRIKVWGDPD